MAGLNSLTFVGNLVDDPDYRVTGSGVAVCNLRIAVTDRRQDASGKWVDGAKLFISGAVWRSTADNVKSSLTKGVEVFVRGKLLQREFNDSSTGAKRTAFEMDISSIGPTLATQSATVVRHNVPSARSAAEPQAAPADDPWLAEHAAAYAGTPDPFNAP